MYIVQAFENYNTHVYIGHKSNENRDMWNKSSIGDRSKNKVSIFTTKFLYLPENSDYNTRNFYD